MPNKPVPEERNGITILQGKLGEWKTLREMGKLVGNDVGTIKRYINQDRVSKSNLRYYYQGNLRSMKMVINEAGIAEYQESRGIKPEEFKSKKAAVTALIQHDPELMESARMSRDAKERKDLAAAEKAELELLKLKGNLIEVAIVSELLKDVAINTRQQLFSMVPRVVADMISKKPDVQRYTQILEKAITKALKGLSKADIN
jgi:transcriptional regulator with AAA-type ATPase domain